MTRPETAPTVVLTRSVTDNESMAGKLQAYGVAAISVPTVEVHGPADDGNALSAALADIDLYHWLVLTSPNGVRAVAATLERLAAESSESPSSVWPEHLRLAVVGPTTAGVATAFGWPVTFQPSQASGACLVQEFPPVEALDSAVAPQRVLVAVAELAAPTVTKGLRRLGYHVDQVTAYRTVEPQAAFDGGQGSAREAIPDGLRTAEAVVFASPSAVDRFLQRFGVDLTPPLVVCIGPSTAQRAEARQLSVAAVAEPHTEGGLVQAITALLAP